MEKFLKIGPWGGTSGDPRGFTADDQTGISHIEIFFGVVIDSITFKWGDEQNQEKNSYKIGGDGGHSVGKIPLDWPKEYLTSISGTFSSYLGQDVIHSISFGTNMEVYGPYGSKEEGTPFSLPMENGEIVGFHGFADPYVNGIGVYAKII